MSLPSCYTTDLVHSADIQAVSVYAARSCSWGGQLTTMESVKSEASGLNDPDRRPSVSIFCYLRDLTRLRTVPVRDLRSYEKCFWLDALRGRVGCASRCFRTDDSATGASAEPREDDAWFTVKKLPEPALPVPPAGIKQWIDPGSGRTSESPPRLLDRIERRTSAAASSRNAASPGPADSVSSTAPAASTVYELLEHHPEVAVAFDNFLRGQWRPWAEKHAAWTAFQEKIYTPLFVMHRDLKRLGEEFELVLGVGCLTWKTPSTQEVRRHLITAQVSLEFDPAGGMFTLRPASDGARLSLEVDMLDPSEQPSVHQREVVVADMSAAGDDPWDFAAIDVALRGFTQAIKENGTYDESAYEPNGIQPVPQTAFAPALLLRRRTSKGLLVALEKVIKDLENGGPIPAGVRRLAKAATNEPAISQSSHPDTSTATSTSSRMYLPLAANEDQREIVERLDGREGVLVQGPPGTGKSHTIANLICHLLATGQRVLVTAQTPRALQVLRDKLPKEIQPLCLSVLGNDKAAQDRIQSSVENITNRADSWNARSAIEEIRKAETELDLLTQRETMLEREVRTFREAELHTHTVAGGAYSGTAQSIAQRVRRESQRFEWFTDAADPKALVPFNADELSAFRSGLGGVSAERAAETKQRRPARGSEYPADDTLIRLIQCSHTLEARLLPASAAEGPLSLAPLDDLREACTALKELQAAVHRIAAPGAPWSALALSDVLGGGSASWELLLSQTAAAVDRLGSAASVLETRDVRLPAGRRSDILLADVTELLGHFQRGGKLGFWIFRTNVVRRTLYLCHEATVDGRPCDHAAALSTAKTHLESCASLAKVWTLWDGKASPRTKAIGQQIGELNALVGILRRVLAVCPLAEAANAALVKLRWAEIPALSDRKGIQAFLARCERVIVRREHDVVCSQLNARVQALRAVADSPNAHPVCARLANALEQRDERAVNAAISDIGALEADAAGLADLAKLQDRISTVLPNLAHSLVATHVDPVWKLRIAEWRAAWHWAQANAWLDRYTDPRKAALVEVELRQVKERIKKCLVRVSTERAWHSCLSTMTSAHQQHLSAWRQAIKKIGKGTGKHAGHWRRVAQGELEECRTAIPAWVMPLYRVFESVTPAAGIFDVVIVDEASQCGPESLLLLYLAKKVIVVGDDKQISPSNIGIDKDQAQALLRQHLRDLPLAETFDIDNSLFDHGEIRLRSRITLREHFRCMPEIIRFSNDLCYNGSLIPLRQYPPKRLAPFVARHLAHGKREGGASTPKNQAEAEAIVETIAACCADPMYRDKSMGVISLLGENQAKLIERLLLQRIGAEEIERRRIVCGDAYSFQGDERHIVFLSLVVSVRDDASRGFSALTKLSDMQRFNVAASRAQDQLWLFHSVMPEDIGNPECMRHRLLGYFYDPARHAAKAIGIDLDDLRSKAIDPEHSALAPTPFDSWFEVDVYLRIADRGYRVLPQYKAGRKRIDLVVEGKTRLAVECDGDYWHGDENLEEDMARQRQLERAGWVFERVRGGVFYSNPDAALVPVWSRLKELGIEPMPAIDGSGSGEGHIPNMPDQSPKFQGDENNASVA
jgi:very-short-patch-repair endonuclease